MKYLKTSLMSNNFWMHNQKFSVNSRNEMTQIWNFFTEQELMNCRDFELPSFNEPSGEGIMERDSIESVCHREEIQVSLLPTEFPYPRGDN